MTRRVSMTCPDIGYSMPRKKFDSGKIRVLILDVYAVCPEPDTSPYSRFSQEYGFVSTNIGTMTQLISHSENGINSLTTIPSRGLAARMTADIEFRAFFKAYFQTGTTAIETIFQMPGLCFSVIIVTVSDLHTNLDSIQSYRHCKSPHVRESGFRNPENCCFKIRNPALWNPEYNPRNPDSR